MFRTVTIDRYARAGDYRIPCRQFNETIMTSQRSYIQDHFFLKNLISRQIAKQSTSQMQDLLGMTSEQFQENRPINVGLDAF